MKTMRIVPAWLLPIIILSCVQNPDNLTEAYFVQDAGARETFFDFPFPNDLRRASGYMDLTGFPNPKNLSLLKTYVAVAEQTLIGFGTNSPIYIRFTAPLDTSTLPATPEDSLSPGSSMFLVNVDRWSPDFRTRVPIIWEFRVTATTYTPPNLLSVAPLWGFPLSPSTAYALVVTDGVKDAKDRSLGVPLTLREYLSSKEPPPVYAAGWKVYSALFWGWGAPIAPDHIRAATIFTTQDPVDELKRIRDYLYSSVPLGTLQDIAFSATSTSGNYFSFEGHYTSPNFQEGDPPYMTEGGRFVFDAQGRPVVQRWESLRFSLIVPATFTEPAGGFPIVMAAHGTGGNYTSHLRDGSGELMTSKGLACIGIDQPLHGPRAPVGTDVEIASFNFFNPYAGRSNFRQSAIDSLSLSRILRSAAIAVTAGTSGPGGTFPTAVTFNPDRVLFFGHSHGGLTGGMFLALDPYVKGGVLSGAGGGLSLTMIYRMSPEILPLLKAAMAIPAGEDVTTFHPIIGLTQALAEVTDPINYARHYYRDLLTAHPRSIFMTEGFIDYYTPNQTAEALAIAGGLPLIQPISRDIPGLGIMGFSPLVPPVMGNLRASNGEWVTGGISQYVATGYNGHYVVYYEAAAKARYSTFLSTLGSTGSAVLE